MRTTTRGVISLQQLQEDFSSVETILREDGEVTVITESGFAFKMSVMNYNDLIRTEEQKKKKMTLPEAIKRVLLAGPQEGMHSVDIAKKITANEFYFKKDGSFVDGKQVRSCASKKKIFLFVYCYVTIDVRPPQLKKDLNPDIILITTKKLIRKDLDR